MSAQDLLYFYKTYQAEKDSGTEESSTASKEIDIYFLLQFFIERHPDGHYITDEFPFYWKGKTYVIIFTKF